MKSNFNHCLERLLKDEGVHSNECFLQRWSVIKTVVGAERMDEIFAKLNLDI